MTKQELPVFDSVAKALVFAFNASDAFYIAPPVMNKAMAEVKVKKAKKSQIALPDADSKTRPSSAPTQPGDRLQGLSKAMQAGFILQQVQRLDHTHADILCASYTDPILICECQSPCCQGYKIKPRWHKSISCICLALKETGDVLRQPGKKGFSTDPTLRRLLVERYFLGNEDSTAKIARLAKVSNTTAAKHDEWITEYLEQEETSAKIQIAAIFDQTGITGLIE